MIRDNTLRLLEILPDILNGDITRIQQDHTEKIFYRGDQVPHNGRIDFTWGFQKFNNFIRGMNVNPFPNPLGYPKALFNDRIFYVDEIEFVALRQNTTPGKIVRLGPDKIWVEIADAIISFTKLRNDEKRKIGCDEFQTQYKLKQNLYFGEINCD